MMLIKKLENTEIQMIKWMSSAISIGNVMRALQPRWFGYEKKLEVSCMSKVMNSS